MYYTTIATNNSFKFDQYYNNIPIIYYLIVKYYMCTPVEIFS